MTYFERKELQAICKDKLSPWRQSDFDLIDEQGVGLRYGRKLSSFYSGFFFNAYCICDCAGTTDRKDSLGNKHMKRWVISPVSVITRFVDDDL